MFGLLSDHCFYLHYPKVFTFAGMFLQGILLGLSLSFLVGPLLFAVVEGGIIWGMRAGIAVAAGIWFSDVLFVALILWSVETLSAITQVDGFRFWAGIFGGLLLLVFGAASFFSKPKLPPPGETFSEKPVKPNYIKLWLRGFLINTINPGTIFFWLGIVSAVVAPNHWSMPQSLTFFSGMLATLVITDTLKAWGAKRLRKFLTPKHIQIVQKSIGLLLMIFGAVLALKSV
ncbi:MAG: LysE family transporter [Saprospiraceae bacterium]|nr:LysE family transporter [Saprospiraceae bacterium]